MLEHATISPGQAHLAANLHTEIIWEVASLLMLSPSLNLESEESESDSFYKPSWSNLENFSRSSKALRTMSLRNWFRVVHIREESDFDFMARELPSIHKWAKAVCWIRPDPENDIEHARSGFSHFNGLTSARLFLPLDKDNYTSPEVLKALPRTICELEIFDGMWPSPIPFFSSIAEAFPDLCILQLRQPPVWCSMCYTCAIPRFSEPFPDKLVYTSGQGLPALYAGRLSSLQKLHTVELTIAVMKGRRALDVKSNPSLWSGECEQCVETVETDDPFRIPWINKKRNFTSIPPNLRRVEWRFLPMAAFDSEWTNLEQQGIYN
ncbi:hypothetical protein DFH11DRAFT_934319 [Phellopilus nigrolimitatus]|nr:hypothetical protein DFH11DRAFT_934319 [Phellopilus nigrolimitatus]